MSDIIHKTFTIADEATESDAINVGGRQLVMFVTDANFAAANVTFKHSSQENGTFITVKDAKNDAVTVTSVDASDCRAIFSLGILGLKWVKIVSSATQSSGPVTIDASLYNPLARPLG